MDGGPGRSEIRRSCLRSILEQSLGRRWSRRTFAIVLFFQGTAQSTPAVRMRIRRESLKHEHVWCPNDIKSLQTSLQLSRLRVSQSSQRLGTMPSREATLLVNEFLQRSTNMISALYRLPSHQSQSLPRPTTMTSASDGLDLLVNTTE